MTKKTWIWIIVGVVGACVLGLVAIAGAGVYLASRHFTTTQYSSVEAMDAFDRARAPFKDQKPLLELNAVDEPRLVRPTRDLPTAKVKPEHLWIMAWTPDEDRLVKISLPFWMLRFGKHRTIKIDGRRDVSLEDLDLDIGELERIGPALVLDVARDGKRVLVWTQ